MKLIVGLGNPGSDYTLTRHNIGWRIADQFANSHNAGHWKSESKFQADVSEVELASEKIILAKPTTFMNLSGQSVQKLVHYYKLTPEQVWITFDEADLNFGDIRTKPSTGKSTHNGIRSIVAEIRTGFHQLRFGIKNDQLTRMPLDKFVLSKFASDEVAEIPRLLDEAVTLLDSELS